MRLITLIILIKYNNKNLFYNYKDMKYSIFLMKNDFY